MKMKKLLSMSVAAVMALSVVGCGGSNPTEGTTGNTEGAANTESAPVAAENTANTDEANTAQSDETLVIALQSEPSSMAPTLVGESENESSIISGAIMDTLVAQDQVTGEIVPNLATAWEWVDDYRLQFTLRDDVKFTDGLYCSLYSFG